MASLRPKELTGLEACKSGADHGDGFAADILLAGKNFLDGVNICAIYARNALRYDGFGSGRKNNCIRLHSNDILSRRLFSELYLNAEFSETVSVVICDPLHSLFEWRQLGKIDRAAESFLTVNEDCLDSSLCKCLCSHHATRAAADNNNFVSLCIRFQVAVALFITCERIDSAFQRKSLRIKTHQCLEASEAVDTFLQFALSALLYFDAPFRIGKPCSAHADEVNNSAFQEGFCNGRLTDSGNADDRDLYIVTNSLDEIFSPALREGNRFNRHEACLIERAADVDEINTCRFHRLDDTDTILDMDVIFRDADCIQEFIYGHAASENEVLAALFADILDDLKNQSHTVLETSAIFIRSLVGIRGEELLQQVAVCAVKLHSIDACLLAAQCRISELFYQLMDLIQCHRTGLLLGHIAHTVRCGDAWLSADQGGDALTAWVMKLNENLASVFVNSCCELCE